MAENADAPIAPARLMIPAGRRNRRARRPPYPKHAAFPSNAKPSAAVRQDAGPDGQDARAPLFTLTLSMIFGAEFPRMDGVARTSAALV